MCGRKHIKETCWLCLNIRAAISWGSLTMCGLVRGSAKPCSCVQTLHEKRSAISCKPVLNHILSYFGLTSEYRRAWKCLKMFYTLLNPVYSGVSCLVPGIGRSKAFNNAWPQVRYPHPALRQENEDIKSFVPTFDTSEQSVHTYGYQEVYSSTSTGYIMFFFAFLKRMESYLLR